MKTHTMCLQWPHIVLPNFTTQNSACRKEASPFCLQRRKTWVSTTWNISEEKQLPWTLCLLQCPKPLPLVDDSPTALWFTSMAAACSALQSLITDAFLSSLFTLPSLVYNGISLCHAEECSRGIEEEVESCCTLDGGSCKLSVSGFVQYCRITAVSQPRYVLTFLAKKHMNNLWSLRA